MPKDMPENMRKTMRVATTCAETEGQKAARETEALFTFATELALQTEEAPLLGLALFEKLGAHLMTATEDLSRRMGYIYLLRVDIYNTQKRDDAEGLAELESEMKDYVDDFGIYKERVEKLARNLEQTINDKLAALAAAGMELATE